MHSSILSDAPLPLASYNCLLIDTTFVTLLLVDCWFGFSIKINIYIIFNDSLFTVPITFDSIDGDYQCCAYCWARVA